MKSSDNLSSGHGRLTHGPEANALVERTLDFVRGELPLWRDRTDRKAETDEETLNAQLCKHLNSKARKLPLPVLFHHEEKQIQRRRVDISAGLEEGGFLGQTYHSIDDPFLVFEGKRLPAPGGAAREREYVAGDENLSGGIQRFKLGLHGGLVNTAAMIGYIQGEASAQWFKRINGWIINVQKGTPVEYGEWSKKDCLTMLKIDSEQGIADCISHHDRKLGPVELVHLWIEMNRK